MIRRFSEWPVAHQKRPWQTTFEDSPCPLPIQSLPIFAGISLAYEPSKEWFFVGEKLVCLSLLHILFLRLTAFGCFVPFCWWWSRCLPPLLLTMCGWRTSEIKHENVTKGSILTRCMQINNDTWYTRYMPLEKKYVVCWSHESWGMIQKQNEQNVVWILLPQESFYRAQPAKASIVQRCRVDRFRKTASSIKVMSKVGWKNKVRFVQNVLQLKKLQVLDTLTYLSWVLMTYVQWFEETACVTNMPSIIVFSKRSSLC